LGNLYFNPAFARDDYRAVAARIEASARPGDAVLLNAPNQWEVFTYYHRVGAPVYPIPSARPPDPAAVAAELAAIAAEHERLFVLWWGQDQSDPERLVETWLSQQAFAAEDTWYGDVRLSIYGVSRGTGANGQLPLAMFGEAFRLEEYTLAPAELVAGDILQLTLGWRYVAADSGSSMPPRKVFVHLAAADGTPTAQHDGEPAAGIRPTTAWQPGEVIQDRHGVLLPPDMPPGEYRLIVGLYDALTGARLPVTLAGQPQGDSLVLRTVQVRAPE
jgi:hypothetical protein